MFFLSAAPGCATGGRRMKDEDFCSQMRNRKWMERERCAILREGIAKVSNGEQKDIILPAGR